MLKNMRISEKKSGFTLIELLVVISIIGMLSSVVLASLNAARIKARDARRLTDLRQLQTALELYYTDNGHFPGSGHYASISNCPTIGATPTVWTTTGVFDSSFTSKYMSVLPDDPNGYCYTYTSFDASSNQTGWQCYRSGVAFDPDGYDSSNQVTGPHYAYLITFNPEGSVSSVYPNFSSANNVRRCLLGPEK